MKRKASLIFGGLTISALFLWLYLSGYLCGKSVDFDEVIRRGATWKSIIEAMQTNIPQKGVVVRFLCPTEQKDSSRLFHKTTFYDFWVRGGKDYTEFWKKFHDPENAIFRDSFFSGKAGIEAEWFVNGASFVGDMKSKFIDTNNYFNVTLLKGLIFEYSKTDVCPVSTEDMDSHFCPSPFLRRLKKANLLNEQSEGFWGTHANFYSNGVLAIDSQDNQLSFYL